MKRKENFSKQLSVTWKALPDLLAASMAASYIPHMHVAEVGCRDLIGRPPAQ